MLSGLFLSHDNVLAFSFETNRVRATLHHFHPLLRHTIMARNQIENQDCEQPTLQTPRGAAPRGLRSDAFEGRPAPLPPQSAQTAEAFEARLPELLESSKPKAPQAREWDFALPSATPPRLEHQLMDRDANWRQHAGLRAPAETAPLPDTSRERFSENWERLASEPPKDRSSKLRRKMEQSPLTRWLFSDGRFDFGSAIGPLLLLLLLLAAFRFGQRMLAGGEKQPPRAAETAPP